MKPNSVHYRACGKWEGNTHKETRSQLHHPCTILWPLAVLASMQNDVSLFAWWDSGFFLSPASVKQESASLESPASWVGDWFCCCRLHSVLLGVIIASFTSVVLQPPATLSLQPAFQFPNGTSTLAGTPKILCNALTIPSHRRSCALFLNPTESVLNQRTWMWVAYPAARVAPSEDVSLAAS